MAQSDKDWLSGAYKQAFGEDRVANYDAKGGAQYWLDKMAENPVSHSRDEVLRMLKGSDEGKKYRGQVEGWDRKGKVSPGGVDPTKSIHSSFLNDSTNDWLQNWAPGGTLAPDNIDDTFTDVNTSLSTINPAASYFNFDDNTFTPPVIQDPNDPNNPGTTPPPGLTLDDLDKWWEGKNQNKSGGGMDDFMKFMMFMSMMRPQGGGGYGGGSQYGYGGLNPGGVMSAYNPLDNITSAISAFQSLPGIGTGNVNTGTAAAT
mgnify:CR=1 FL=1